MSLPPEELRRTPPVLTNHDPFSITFLRMDDGRKLHADVSRQTWDEEAPRPPEFHQHAYYESISDKRVFKICDQCFCHSLNPPFPGVIKSLPGALMR